MRNIRQIADHGHKVVIIGLAVILLTVLLMNGLDTPPLNHSSTAALGIRG